MSCPCRRLPGLCVLGLFMHPRTNRGAVTGTVAQLTGPRSQLHQPASGGRAARRSSVQCKSTKQTKQTKQRDNKQTDRYRGWALLHALLLRNRMDGVVRLALTPLAPSLGSLVSIARPNPDRWLPSAGLLPRGDLRPPHPFTCRLKLPHENPREESAPATPLPPKENLREESAPSIEDGWVMFTHRDVVACMAN